jgi:hypothetical protein
MVNWGSFCSWSVNAAYSWNQWFIQERLQNSNSKDGRHIKLVKFGKKKRVKLPYSTWWTQGSTTCYQFINEYILAYFYKCLRGKSVNQMELTLHQPQRSKHLQEAFILFIVVLTLGTPLNQDQYIWKQAR